MLLIRRLVEGTMKPDYIWPPLPLQPTAANWPPPPMAMCFPSATRKVALYGKRVSWAPPWRPLGETPLSRVRDSACAATLGRRRVSPSLANEWSGWGRGTRREWRKSAKGAGLRSGAAPAMATVDAEVSTSAGGVRLSPGWGGGGGMREGRAWASNGISPNQTPSNRSFAHDSLLLS